MSQFDYLISFLLQNITFFLALSGRFCSTYLLPIFHSVSPSIPSLRSYLRSTSCSSSPYHLSHSFPPSIYSFWLSIFDPSHSFLLSPSLTFSFLPLSFLSSYSFFLNPLIPFLLLFLCHSIGCDGQTMGQGSWSSEHVLRSDHPRSPIHHVSYSSSTSYTSSSHSSPSSTSSSPFLFSLFQREI